MKTLFASIIAALLVAACGGGQAVTPAATSAATEHQQHATNAAAAKAQTAATPTALAAGTGSPAPSASPAAATTAQPPSVTTAPAATAPAATAPAATAPAATATEPPKPLPTITPAPTAAASAPAAKTTIAVTLTDAMTIVLGQSSAPVGTVTFTVRNGGSVLHDLIVLKTSLAQGQIPADPTQPALATTPGLVGKAASLAPGASTTLTLTLGAGSYVLLCNQPAHYLAGMHAAFTVTAPVSLIGPDALSVLS